MMAVYKPPKNTQVGPKVSVTWRIKTVKALHETNIDTLDSRDADRLYLMFSKTLKKPNDRVVLYRIKLVDDYVRVRRYQDTYKSDIMDDQGELIHLRNCAPHTWQEASQRRMKAREVRRQRHQVRKAQMAWLRQLINQEELNA